MQEEPNSCVEAFQQRLGALRKTRGQYQQLSLEDAAKACLVTETGEVVWYSEDGGSFLLLLMGLWSSETQEEILWFLLRIREQPDVSGLVSACCEWLRGLLLSPELTLQAWVAVLQLYSTDRAFLLETSSLLCRRYFGAKGRQVDEFFGPLLSCCIQVTEREHLAAVFQEAFLAYFQRTPAASLYILATEAQKLAFPRLLEALMQALGPAEAENSTPLRELWATLILLRPDTQVAPPEGMRDLRQKFFAACRMQPAALLHAQNDAGPLEKSLVEAANFCAQGTAPSDNPLSIRVLLLIRGRQELLENEEPVCVGYVLARLCLQLKRRMAAVLAAFAGDLRAMFSAKAWEAGVRVALEVFSSLPDKEIKQEGTVLANLGEFQTTSQGHGWEQLDKGAREMAELLCDAALSQAGGASAREKEYYEIPSVEPDPEELRAAVLLAYKKGLLPNAQASEVALLFGDELTVETTDRVWALLQRVCHPTEALRCRPDVFPHTAPWATRVQFVRLQVAREFILQHPQLEGALEAPDGTEDEETLGVLCLWLGRIYRGPRARPGFLAASAFYFHQRRRVERLVENLREREGYATQRSPGALQIQQWQSEAQGRVLGVLESLASLSLQEEDGHIGEAFRAGFREFREDFQGLFSAPEAACEVAGLSGAVLEPGPCVLQTLRQYSGFLLPGDLETASGSLVSLASGLGVRRAARKVAEAISGGKAGFTRYQRCLYDLLTRLFACGGWAVELRVQSQDSVFRRQLRQALLETLYGVFQLQPISLQECVQEAAGGGKSGLDFDAFAGKFGPAALYYAAQQYTELYRKAQTRPGKPRSQETAECLLGRLSQETQSVQRDHLIRLFEDPLVTTRQTQEIEEPEEGFTLRFTQPQAAGPSPAVFEADLLAYALRGTGPLSALDRVYLKPCGRVLFSFSDLFLLPPQVESKDQATRLRTFLGLYFMRALRGMVLHYPQQPVKSQDAARCTQFGAGLAELTGELFGLFQWLRGNVFCADVCVQLLHQMAVLLRIQNQARLHKAKQYRLLEACTFTMELADLDKLLQQKGLLVFEEPEIHTMRLCIGAMARVFQAYYGMRLLLPGFAGPPGLIGEYMEKKTLYGENVFALARKASEFGMECYPLSDKLLSQPETTQLELDCWWTTLWTRLVRAVQRSGNPMLRLAEQDFIVFKCQVSYFCFSKPLPESVPEEEDELETELCLQQTTYLIKALFDMVASGAQSQTGTQLNHEQGSFLQRTHENKLAVRHFPMLVYEKTHPISQEVLDTMGFDPEEFQIFKDMNADLLALIQGMLAEMTSKLLVPHDYARHLDKIDAVTQPEQRRF